MKHRVSELEGALLDAAVAKAGNAIWELSDGGVRVWGWGVQRATYSVPYQPSTEWEDGGQIIQGEGIAFLPAPEPASDGRLSWRAMVVGGPRQDGPTHLIAGMRAYVASKFGDEVVDLP